MPVEIPLEVQIEIMRDSIVALLSLDPLNPFAQVLGRELRDLECELLNH